ncbi:MULTISPECIES: hypothetical protein [unclassified Saccharopolyspora]|nr:MULTISPECIES: hypothetical protein [unclassified Saccharopolyspora]
MTTSTRNAIVATGRAVDAATVPEGVAAMPAEPAGRERAGI